jgi:LPXTG-motif cell wall-anchored protein
MRFLVSLLLVLPVLVAAAGPASADDSDRLGLSSDGVTWSSWLTEPLFDEGVRWVPGDERIASFFVRNQATDDAQLSIDVLGSTSDELIRTGELTISARSGSGPWTDISAPGRQRLVTWVPTETGEVRRIDIRVIFRPGGTNQSQVLALNLFFQASLREDIPVDAQPTPTPTDEFDTAVDLPSPTLGRGALSDGILPSTGAPVFWTAFAGLAMLAGGIIVALSRRQESNDHV